MEGRGEEGWGERSVLVLRSCELHPQLGPRACHLKVSMIHTCGSLERERRTDEGALGLYLGEENPEKSDGILCLTRGIGTQNQSSSLVRKNNIDKALTGPVTVPDSRCEARFPVLGICHNLSSLLMS